ncbi:MAG: PQQ-like beta-propeller repeat protein, partial [Bryobacteraceae bacterium]|nr:PQQ-like beta-propeller repeat protein [Bryobacteraceae bacterium]
FTREGLVAADPAKGTIRFRFPWKSRSQSSINAAVPVVSGDLIFASASYGTGAVVLDVSRGQTKQVWASDESLSSHYATSVLLNGYLYGFHGRQEMGPSLRCVELKTGKVMWSVEGFGAGTLMLAGNRLLIVRESGEAVLAEANPKAFTADGKVQLLPAVVRSYAALAEGVLFVRNENTMAAWRVSAGK